MQQNVPSSSYVIRTASYVPAGDILGDSRFLMEMRFDSNFVFGFVFGANSHSLISCGDLLRWLNDLEEDVRSGEFSGEDEISDFGTQDSLLAEIEQARNRLRELPPSVYIDLE